jgi:PTH1 family peptidyl-tRNA hydrolase
MIGSDYMKLIVGLGNPGKEYEKTRHNIGFNVIDFYLQKKNIHDRWVDKFDGLVLSTSIYGEKVIFLKPHTFMNLSGISVKKVVDYYNISIDDVLIICDDLDLFIGNYKLKLNGSSGGHNGLKSIEEYLHSSNYKRIKIGISNDKNMDTKDYVLGRFSKKENDILVDVYDSVCNIIDDYFSLSFSDLMCKYNRKNR